MEVTPSPQSRDTTGWYRRAAIATAVALAVAVFAYFAFDLDDWNNLSKGQVEKLLAVRFHTKVHCSDIPNDGDETLQGYEYTCTLQSGGGDWVAVDSSRITGIQFTG
jgi:hypothetical protein